MPDPPSSSHTFLATEYAAQDKILLSWSGADAGQVLLARSDPRLPTGTLVPASVQVDDGAGGFYALSLMPVSLPWQAAYATDPALAEANLDPGGAAQLAKLFGGKAEIEAAAGANTQGSSTAPGGAAGYFRLELDHPDSDGDGAPDWQELGGGSDAFHPDTDRDGFGDGWEVANGLDPVAATGIAAAAAQLESLAPTARLHLLIGDNSSSITETYHLVVYELDPESDEEAYEFYRLKMASGSDIARTDQAPLEALPVRRDRAYHTVIEWQSSTAGTPDYDYVMEVWEEVESGELPKLWITDLGNMVYQYVGQPDDHREDAPEEDVKEVNGVDARPRVAAVPFLVEGLRFKGDAAPAVRFKMASDNGDTYGTTPFGLWHWRVEHGTGAQDPVLYKRNTNLSVIASVRPGKDPGAGVVLTGYGTATEQSLNGGASEEFKYDFGTEGDAIAFAKNGKSFTSPETTAAKQLPNTVEYYPGFEIEWKVSPDGGAKWFDAGSTKNPVYVSLKDPTIGFPRHTIVHLACSNGHATTEQEAFANSWALLAGPANFETWDEKPLHYYKKVFDDCPNQLADTMLAEAHGSDYGDGQCGAWQDLFFKANQVNAVGGVVKVTAAREDSLANFMLIRHWDPANPPSHPGDDYPYAWGGDFTNVAGIAGQNQPTPLAKKFTDHRFVLYETLTIGGTGAGPYFDPAYGTWYSGEADFEAKAIEAYLNATESRAKLPDAGAAENITFTPPPAP